MPAANLYSMTPQRIITYRFWRAVGDRLDWRGVWQKNRLIADAGVHLIDSRQGGAADETSNIHSGSNRFLCRNERDACGGHVQRKLEAEPGEVEIRSRSGAEGSQLQQDR